jgi:hypothetical protein
LEIGYPWPELYIAGLELTNSGSESHNSYPEFSLRWLVISHSELEKNYFLTGIIFFEPAIMFFQPEIILRSIAKNFRSQATMLCLPAIDLRSQEKKRRFTDLYNLLMGIAPG